MSIFEKASRLKLRFDTPKGFLSVDDLWDLHLISDIGRANLDDIARDLNRQLKNTEVSFVRENQGADETLQLQFDIVKHIIDVRLAEQNAALAAKEKAERKQKILAIMSDKQEASLRGLPLEDLQRLVNEL
jgi:hypothetical protein